MLIEFTIDTEYFTDLICQGQTYTNQGDLEIK